MKSKELKYLIQKARVNANSIVLPALEATKLVIKDGKATATSTDITQTRVVTCDLDHPDIEVLFPPRHLSALSEISGDVTLNLDENKLSLKSKNGNYVESIYAFEDYPDTPEVEGISFHVTADYLDQLAKVNTKFASNDDLRLALTGVYFDIDNQMSAVSTDAQKLIVSKHDLGIQNAMDFILPASFVKQLQGVFVMDVEVVVGERQIAFKSGNTVMMCKRIDAKYPDYKGVIPETDKEVKVNRVEMINSLKRVGLFTNKSTDQVILSINQNEIEIKGIDLDYDVEGVELISCQSNVELQIGFSHKWLKLALETFDLEYVTLRFRDKSTAMVIEEGDDLVLVMPVMFGV